MGDTLSNHDFIDLYTQRLALTLFADPQQKTRGFSDATDLKKEIRREVLKTLGKKKSDVSTQKTSSLIKKELSKLDEQLGESRALLHISEQFALSATEEKVLALAVALEESEIAIRPARNIRLNNKRAFAAVITRVLDCELSEVLSAIHPRSPLVRSGLLKSAPNCSRAVDLEDFLDPAEGLSLELLYSPDEQRDYLEKKCQLIGQPTCSIEDFSYLREDIHIIGQLLDKASLTKTKGINILIHGKPGTGKTELSYALAKEGSFSAGSIADQDDDEDPLSARARLSNYLINQRLQAQRAKPLIVFDEVEEVLSSEGTLRSAFSSEAEASKQKSWKCRILESNPVPAIWIGNSIRDIDPALLRRFTYTLHLGSPPEEKRRHMLLNSMSNFDLDESLLIDVAKHENITPSEIARTEKVMTLIGSESDNPTTLFRHVIASRAGNRNLPKRPRKIIQMPYDKAWLNTDPPVDTLVEHLKLAGHGRLGFFGPPGTGKTALAKHIAKTLGIACQIKRASDLLDKFVGGTEKNIADAFYEAQENETLLLIDEIDSLLASRQNASHQWEVTQVNELLTQIDDYDGFLIVATNFHDHLDDAVFRRLDIKVNFRAMTAKQFELAFKTIAQSLGSSDDEIQSALKYATKQCNAVTLGDVSTAYRRVCYQPNKSVSALAEGCINENQQRLEREQGGHRIGFV